MTTSRLGRQIAEIISALNRENIRFALIGGLALAAHNVVRATQDVDVLIGATDADRLEGVLVGLGYRRLHRNADASNYLREDERLDVLYASRPTAMNLLSKAPMESTAFGMLPVIGTEGLIGFKLQALINNPRRTQDLEDIRALMHANRATLDMHEVREYFRMFEREALLDEILHENSRTTI
ncbi:MAG: nucleotidyltransferase family protein [Gammaproteobacteria bacterium]